MGEQDKGKVQDAVARMAEQVAKEVEKHKDEDVDLEDVSGGWAISYTTDVQQSIE